MRDASSLLVNDSPWLRVVARPPPALQRRRSRAQRIHPVNSICRVYSPDGGQLAKDTGHSPKEGTGHSPKALCHSWRCWPCCSFPTPFFLLSYTALAHIIGTPRVQPITSAPFLRVQVLLFVTTFDRFGTNLTRKAGWLKQPRGHKEKKNPGKIRGCRVPRIYIYIYFRGIIYTGIYLRLCDIAFVDSPRAVIRPFPAPRLLCLFSSAVSSSAVVVRCTCFER